MYSRILNALNRASDNAVGWQVRHACQKVSRSLPCYLFTPTAYNGWLCNPSHARLLGMVQQLEKATLAVAVATDPGGHELAWSWEDSLLQQIAEEAVFLVFGDQAEEAAADAVDLVRAKRLAAQLKVPHTYCV